MRASVKTCAGLCPALLLLVLTLLAGCTPAAENAAEDGVAPGATPTASTDEAPEADGFVLVGELSGSEDALPASDAIARANDLDGQDVRIEGPISAVCQQAGCWLRMGSDDPDQALRVNVPRDSSGSYVFTFPMDVAGADALVEGVLAVEETDVETLRHFAEDEGATDEEIAAITEPRRTVILNATGARIRRADA